MRESLPSALFASSLLALAAGCAAPAREAPAPASAVPAEAQRADARLPDFSLATIDGETFTLSEHVGREVIVLSFWATWCVPCIAELPHLEELYQAEKERGLLVVAVAMDEPSSIAEVAPTARRLGLTMPVVLDGQQQAVRLYNRSRSAPMTVVIDRQGAIVRSTAGYNPGDEERLAEEVRALLSR
jgi:peroxiredoxin